MARRLTPPALACVWAAAVSLVTLPGAVGGALSWLDASWELALGLSNRLQHPMGSRLFSTYGSYGYLTVNTPFFAQQWLQAAVATLLMHAATVALIAYLLVRRRSGTLLWIIATPALILALPPVAGIATEGPVVAIVLAYLAVDLDGRRGRICAALALGGVLALLLLVKATAVPLVVGVIVLTVPLLLWQKRRSEAATITGSFVVGFALLWLSSGLGASEVPGYLRAALNFGAGYSGAMYTMGLTAGIVVGGAVIIGVSLLGVGLLARRRVADSLWMLLVALVLFLLFKDTFVRDGPVRQANFFGTVAMLAAASLAVAAPRARTWLSRRQLIPVAALLGLVALGLGWRVTDTTVALAVGDRLGGYRSALHALIDANTRHALQDRTLRSAQAYYSPIIAALPQLPQRATVDVMPVDTGLIYADPHLNWSPRPVLQSYQAYTPWLDQLDADFLRSPAAPEFIVYGYQTIDDRYAAFDEPATFRALMDTYRVLRVLGPSAALLQRLPAGQPPPETAATRVCAPLGAPVQVPAHATGRTYGRVELGRSLSGRVLDLVAKSAEARITLTTKLGSDDHRLVTAVAGDGLYLSQYLGSTGDFGVALSGSAAGLPITSLTIHGEHWAWSDQYCVTFTTTATPTANR